MKCLCVWHEKWSLPIHRAERRWPKWAAREAGFGLVMMMIGTMMMVTRGCSEEGVDWVCQLRQSTPMHSLFLLHGGDDDDDYAWTMFMNMKIIVVWWWGGYSFKAYHNGGDGGNVERRAAQCKWGRSWWWWWWYPNIKDISLFNPHILKRGQHTLIKRLDVVIFCVVRPQPFNH